MMKSKTLALQILASILPLGVIILNLTDIYDVYYGKGDYPFGSDFFEGYSIYSSRNIYVIYNIAFTLLLIVNIFLAFRAKWTMFFIVLFLNIVLFCYPFITN